jgi:hypothetical protein
LNIFFLSQGEITGKTVQERGSIGFEIYTSANCSENNGSISCYDDIYLSCNNVETKLGNVLGENVEFDLSWEDPRKESL